MSIRIGDHRHHHHQPGPLEIGEMARFDDTLDECDDEERKRRRILYLREALAQIKTGKSIMAVFGVFFIPFLLFPCFWPVLLFMYFILNKQKETVKRQFATALEYWELGQEEVEPESNQR